MTEQLWCAKIERTDGQTIAYRLSGDLQHALDIDVAGQRHLLHGLIVIPLAPYIFAKPMGTKDDVLPHTVLDSSHRSTSKRVTKPLC